MLKLDTLTSCYPNWIKLTMKKRKWCHKLKYDTKCEYNVWNWHNAHTDRKL